MLIISYIRIIHTYHHTVALSFCGFTPPTCTRSTATVALVNSGCAWCDAPGVKDPCIGDEHPGSNNPTKWRKRKNPLQEHHEACQIVGRNPPVHPNIAGMSPAIIPRLHPSSSSTKTRRYTTAACSLTTGRFRVAPVHPPSPRSIAYTA